MSRKPKHNKLNNRTTPKGGTVVQTHDESGELIDVKWCKNHQRFERTKTGPSTQAVN